MDRRILGEGRQLGFDRGQNPRDLGRRTVKILGREDPQGHGRDGELGAPFEDLVELVGAEVVDRARLDDAERAAMAAIAVEDDADMTRPRALLRILRASRRAYR